MYSLLSLSFETESNKNSKKNSKKNSNTKQMFETKIKVLGKRIPMLRFTDDVGLFAESKVEFGIMMNGMKKLIIEEFVLKIDENKTKVIKVLEMEIGIL